MKALKLLLLLLLISPIASLDAQEIKGKLIDEGGEALGFATIQLLNADSSLNKLETSRSDGTFEFKRLEAKRYFLAISFLGYKTHMQSVDLAVENGNLKTITLETSSTELETVDIVDEKPIVEVEPDKTIFNVSKNLNTVGDNGIELLRKAPGLQVDNNDNILVEGKAGITVYINGKQSFLQGQDLTNYIKSLRAEEIEKVEIITQPSSKYDAAGNAGILNIVLKREKGLGTKGTITNTFTQGEYPRNNTTLNVNHRAKKFASFLNYSHFQGKSSGFFDMYREQSGNVFDNESESTNDMMNDRLTIGGDYYLSKKSTLSTSIMGSWNSMVNENNSETKIAQINDLSTDSILWAPNRNENDVQNYNANLGYVFEDTSGHRLELNFDYVYFESDRNTLQPNIYLGPAGDEVLSENINFQNTPIQIDAISGKVDYEQMVKKVKLSFGSKASQVVTSNIFDFYDVEQGERIFDPNRSNVFDYEEVILAGYLNLAFSHKKFKFQAGLRAEQTFSKGDLQANQDIDNKVVEREYLDWFPSAGITWQQSRKNSTALIYSRRIDRPNYQNLNPFEFQINELGYRKGNPFLQPQYTHNIKLSNTYNYTLTTSLSYSYVSDFFAEVSEADGDRVSFINTRNVADQEIINFSVSYPKKFNDWFSVYSNVYTYYTNFTANDPDFLPIDRIVYGGYGQMTFKLSKVYQAEVSGWIQSPAIWRGTFRTETLGSLNLAVQRSWNSWTAKLSFNDVLYTIPWRAENRFGDLYLTGTGGSDSRNVRLYLSYTFGQKDVKTAKKRSSSSEDEQNRMQ
ncbi:MAG: TonB-dependent receptor [Flavobacteriales bacterium]|nr:TonB-dependent receptor [Flavobacteriales bacterium]